MEMPERFDRNHVIEVGHAFFASLDERDWEVARGLFAPSVMLNMTAGTGGRAEQVTPDEILAGWRTSLDLPDGLHHQVGNQRVEFSQRGARLYCSVLSIHYYGNLPRWTKMFVGNYTLGFGLHCFDGRDRLLIEEFSYRHSFKIDAGTFWRGEAV